MKDFDEDPIYQDLVGELCHVAERLADHMERTSGVRFPAEQLVAMALEDRIEQRNAKTAKQGNTDVPSLTARRLASGRQAVVQSAIVEKVSFTDVALVGGVGFVRELAVRFYGEATDKAVARVMQSAIDRGMASLKRAAAARDD